MAISSEVLLAGKFLQEALTFYDSNIADTVYPEYWGYEGMYHQAIADLPLGAQGLTTARMDYTGRAANFGGKATTFPLANFGMNMDSYKTVRGVLAADWTWEELRAAEMAANNPMFPKTNIVESYRAALEKGLREWMHLKTVFGDSTLGFMGLFNNRYVETIDIAANLNPITGSGTIQAPYTGFNAANTYEWFRRETSSFRKANRLTATQTVAFVSEDIRAALQQRYADGTNDGTPAMSLTSRSDSPSLRQIITLNEADGSVQRDVNWGNLTTLNGITLPATYDYVLLCDGTFENNIKRHYANIQTTQPALLDDQMTYRIVGVCATSEVIFTQPFRARIYILRKS